LLPPDDRCLIALVAAHLHSHLSTIYSDLLVLARFCSLIALLENYESEVSLSEDIDRLNISKGLEMFPEYAWSGPDAADEEPPALC